MNLSKEYISQKVHGNLQKDPNRTARAKTVKFNIIYISKIIYKKKVHQILNKLIINPRIGTKIHMRDPLKPNSRSSLSRHIKLYNALPLDLKSLNPNRLRRKLKKLQVSFKD